MPFTQDLQYSSPGHFPHFADRNQETKELNESSKINWKKPNLWNSFWCQSRVMRISFRWKKLPVSPSIGPQGHSNLKTCCISCSWHPTNCTGLNPGTGCICYTKCKSPLCNTWLKGPAASCHGTVQGGGAGKKPKEYTQHPLHQLPWLGQGCLGRAAAGPVKSIL